MTGDLNELNRSLGILQGEVRGQTETVRSLQDQWRRQEESASEGRRRLYESIEGFKGEVGKRMAYLEQQSEMHTNQFSIFAPTIKEWETMKEQTRGAARLGRAMYVVVVGLVVGLTWLATHLHDLFTAAPPKP